MPTWLAVASCSDVYGVKDKTAVYRMHSNGACARLGAALWRDNLLVRIYFNKIALKLDYHDLPPGFTYDWVATNCTILSQKGYLDRIKGLCGLFINRVGRQLVFSSSVSERVVSLYAKYCAYKVQRRRWHFFNRCQGLTRHIVRCLSPECVRRIRRKFTRPTKKAFLGSR